MKNMKTIISALLCFLMVFNPVLFEAALWAEDASATAVVENKDMKATEESTDKAAAQTDSAYEKLLNTKSAATKWYMSSGTKNKIKDANQQLGAAKTQTKDAKTSVSDVKTEVKAIGETISGDDNTFDKMTKVAAGVQKVLIKTGQMLQKIGQLLKTIGTALQAIGKVLSAIPWTAAIGQALNTAGGIMVKVGTALDYVGKAIEKVGQTAANADMKFGDLLGTVTQAAKDGWKQGETDAAANNQKLDENLKTTDTSKDMEGASEETKPAADDTEEVEDADQEGVADI